MWVLVLSQKLKAQRRICLTWPFPVYQMSFAAAGAYTNGELDQEFLHDTMGLLWL